MDDKDHTEKSQEDTVSRVMISHVFKTGFPLKVKCYKGVASFEFFFDFWNILENFLYAENERKILNLKEIGWIKHNFAELNINMLDLKKMCWI